MAEVASPATGAATIADTGDVAPSVSAAELDVAAPQPLAVSPARKHCSPILADALQWLPTPEAQETAMKKALRAVGERYMMHDVVGMEYVMIPGVTSPRLMFVVREVDKHGAYIVEKDGSYRTTRAQTVAVASFSDTTAFLGSIHKSKVPLISTQISTKEGTATEHAYSYPNELHLMSNPFFLTGPLSKNGGGTPMLAMNVNPQLLDYLATATIDFLRKGGRIKGLTMPGPNPPLSAYGVGAYNRTYNLQAPSTGIGYPAFASSELQKVQQHQIPTETELDAIFRATPRRADLDRIVREFFRGDLPPAHTQATILLNCEKLTKMLDELHKPDCTFDPLAYGKHILRQPKASQLNSVRDAAVNIITPDGSIREATLRELWEMDHPMRTTTCLLVVASVSPSMYAPPDQDKPSALLVIERCQIAGICLRPPGLAGSNAIDIDASPVTAEMAEAMLQRLYGQYAVPDKIKSVTNTAQKSLEEGGAGKTPDKGQQSDPVNGAGTLQTTSGDSHKQVPAEVEDNVLAELDLDAISQSADASARKEADEPTQSSPTQEDAPMVEELPTKTKRGRKAADDGLAPSSKRSKHF